MLKNIIIQDAKHSRQYISKIEDDVLKQCRLFFDNQIATSNKLQGAGKLYQKEIIGS